MSDAGQHRHQSFARRVSLPSVTAAAVLVGAAVVVGEVNLLRATAVVVLIVVVVVAVLFDQELVRDRRAHGLDRAILARAYAVEYAGWVQEQSAVGYSLLPPSELSNGWSGRTVPSNTLPMIVGDTEDATDLWDELGDAPTVVNLAAWEERLRESRDDVPSEDTDALEDAETDAATDADVDVEADASADATVDGEVVAEIRTAADGEADTDADAGVDAEADANLAAERKPA